MIQRQLAKSNGNNNVSDYPQSNNYISHLDLSEDYDMGIC